MRENCQSYFEGAVITRNKMNKILSEEIKLTVYLFINE